MNRAYKADRTTIGIIVEGLLSSEQSVVENAAAGNFALNLYRAGKKVDLSDALIAATATLEEVGATVTFDKTAAQEAGMRLLTAS